MEYVLADCVDVRDIRQLTLYTICLQNNVIKFHFIFTGGTFWLCFLFWWGRGLC